jgi:hypothetical protein
MAKSLEQAVRSAVAGAGLTLLSALPLNAQQAQPQFLCADGPQVQAVQPYAHCDDIAGTVVGADTVWSAEVYQLRDAPGRVEPQRQVGNLRPVSTAVNDFSGVEYRLIDPAGRPVDLPIQPEGLPAGDTRVVLGPGNSIELSRESRAFADLMNWRMVVDGVYQFDAAQAIRANPEWFSAGQACITGHVVSRSGETRAGFAVRARQESEPVIAKDPAPAAPPIECQIPPGYAAPPPAPPVAPPPPTPVAPPVIVREPLPLRLNAGIAYKDEGFWALSSHEERTACFNAAGLALLVDGAYTAPQQLATGMLLYAPSMDSECFRGEEFKTSILEGNLNAVMGAPFGLGGAMDFFRLDADNPEGTEFRTFMAGLGPAFRQHNEHGGLFYMSPGVGLVSGNDDEHSWNGLAGQGFVGYIHGPVQLEAAGHIFRHDRTDGHSYRLDGSVGVPLGPTELRLHAGWREDWVCTFEEGVFEDRISQGKQWYGGVTARIPLR